jgi:catechol 2,3-dioxygenase-like lactoylglutathione lyase family enzyme
MGDSASNVTGFWHAGVTVSDTDAALIFYRDGLGLEVQADFRIEADDFVDRFYGDKEIGSPRVVYLGVPGSDVIVELFEFPDVDGESAASPPWNHGGGHLCLYVDDADAIHARIEELGFTSLNGTVMRIEDGPAAGSKCAYLIDGDGYHVEIYQPA